MKFVLFGAAKPVRWLKILGWVLLFASLPALEWWPLWLGLVVTSVTLLLVSWNITAPDARCVMCLRERDAVLSLIAGEHAGVCDDCSVTAAALATADQLTRASSKSLWAMSVLRTMPNLTPNAVSGPLLEHAWNIEGVDRNALLEEAERLGNPGVKVTFYESTKDEARSATEWVNLGVALCATRRFDEALAATRRANEAINEPWVLNNVAAIKLRSGVNAGELEGLLADTRRARVLLVEQKTHRWEAALPVFINNEAELELRLGREAAALEHLDESARLAAPNTRALLTRHAALTALGRHDESKTVGEQAKKQVHPDSLEAAEVSALG